MIIGLELQGMSEFGGVHNDKEDDAASKTAMIVNSQLPAGYEPGCFHLLSLELSFILKHLLVPIFCGLANHVLYPLKCKLSQAGKAQKCVLYSLP
jgi:hypothetical protein